MKKSLILAVIGCIALAGCSSKSEVESVQLSPKQIVANQYLNGESPDFHQLTLDEIMKMADSGDPHAQYYAWHKMQSKSEFESAYKYLKASADGGRTDSMWLIGQFNKTNDKDYEPYLDEYRESAFMRYTSNAADLGDPKAQLTYANYFRFERTKPYNKTNTNYMLHYYKMLLNNQYASKAQLEDAYKALSFMHEYGMNGVSQNTRLARTYLQTCISRLGESYECQRKLDLLN